MVKKIQSTFRKKRKPLDIRRALLTLTLLLLTAQANTQTEWISLSKSGREVKGFDFTGPNFSFCATGNEGMIDVYELDLISGTSVHRKSINVSASQSKARIAALENFNAVFLNYKAIRVDLDPSSSNSESLFTGVSTGIKIDAFAKIDSTDYVFTAQSGSSSPQLSYRLNPMDDSEFNSYALSNQAYGVVKRKGTNFVIVSLSGSNREIFDYTEVQTDSNPVAKVGNMAKGHSNMEKVLLSPDDGRDLIVASENPLTIRSIYYPNNSQLSTRTLTRSTSSDWIYAGDHIPGSEYVAIVFFRKQIAITKYNEDQEAPVYIQAGSGSNYSMREIKVHPSMRLFGFSMGSSSISKIYKLPQYPCLDSLAATCNDIDPSLTISCKDFSSFNTSSGKCECDLQYYKSEHEFYKTRDACVSCHSDCKTCDGASDDNCLSCNDNLKNLESGMCVDPPTPPAPPTPPTPPIEPASEPATTPDSNTSSPGCENNFYPDENNITECHPCYLLFERTDPSLCEAGLNFGLTKESIFAHEGSLTITIDSDFSQIPKNDLDFSDFFRISLLPLDSSVYQETVYKIRGINYAPETEIEIELLSRKELEKSQKLKISLKKLVLDPLSQSDGDFSSSTGSYFFNKSKEIPVKYLPKTDEEEELQRQAANNQTALMISTATTTAGLILTTALASSGSGTTLLYMIKLFQILEILSNIAKMNLVLGKNLKIVLDFIENLTFPEISFIQNLSPIKDTSRKDEDYYAYVKYSRGSRAKMTTKNGDLFIFSGQNFFFSCVMVASWTLSRILQLFLEKNNLFLRTLKIIFVVIFGCLYFDYQIIALTEVGAHDIFKRQKIKFYFSYLASLSFLFISTIEMLRVIRMLDQKMDRRKFDSLSFEQKMIFDLYSEGLSYQRIKKGSKIIVIGKIRFLVIQGIIASLQLLNRVQAFTVFIANGVYCVFLFRSMKAKGKFFDSTMVFFKHVGQELCLMVVLTVIMIFSLTENSEFSKTGFYNIMEIMAIIGIIVAAGLECLSTLTCIVKDIVRNLKKLCKKKPRKTSPRRNSELQKIKKSRRQPIVFKLSNKKEKEETTEFFGKKKDGVLKAKIGLKSRSRLSLMRGRVRRSSRDYRQRVLSGRNEIKTLFKRKNEAGKQPVFKDGVTTSHFSRKMDLKLRRKKKE